MMTADLDLSHRTAKNHLPRTSTSDYLGARNRRLTETRVPYHDHYESRRSNGHGGYHGRQEKGPECGNRADRALLWQGLDHAHGRHLEDGDRRHTHGRDQP